MKVELAPLIAPDRFEEELEAEIAAWFSETVFRPLFAEFELDRENAFDPNEPRDRAGKWTKSGASKAPAVVYHGTNADFEEFDESKMGENDEGWLGRGFYFSTDKNVASAYRFQKEVELRIENPLELELPDFKTDKRGLVKSALGLPKTATGAMVTAAARERGYDGVILDYGKTGYAHKEIVAFSKDQIRAAGGDRPNAVEDWTPFPSKLVSLGISRSKMPQIHAEDRAALVSYLESRGIASVQIRAYPTSFRPTQECYSPAKIEAARAYSGSDRPILSASNDRILDGHHQWYAAFLDDPFEQIDVIVFDVPIKRLLREVDRFPGTTRENAVGDSEALFSAVNAGTISYADGVFSGRFSAATSRAIRAIGGTFDKARKIYRVDPKALPYTIRGSLAAARERAEAIKNGIVVRTAEIAANVAASPTLGIKLERYTKSLLSNLEGQLMDSLTAVTKATPAIEVVATPPDFTPTMVKDVREMLTHNIELSIKAFTEEEMVRIRELAEQNWTLGGRVDRLREMIEARFDVTKRKARFLARQETSMVASEFARARAQEIGSTEYVWHTRHDDRVRDDHQELNGKTFEWDDPPVVDKLRDRHANPGMDYGCRCVARAVLNLQARRVA